ncbi:MAG TPA: hypothetical protein VG711_01335 [Phycisphaerales bacterium]|nr:hypothetical protein [Phycisphaerales bacterium]
MMRMISNMIRCAALMLTAMAMTACGGYTFRAKVIQGPISEISFMAADDPRIQQPGISGVWVAAFRDPQSPDRKMYGGMLSNSNGDVTFPIQGFGAGWLEEQWEVQATLKGYRRVKTNITLPSDSKKTWVLITLAPGESAEDDDFHDQFDKFH